MEKYQKENVQNTAYKSRTYVIANLAYIAAWNEYYARP